MRTARLAFLTIFLLLGCKEVEPVLAPRFEGIEATEIKYRTATLKAVLSEDFPALTTERATELYGFILEAPDGSSRTITAQADGSGLTAEVKSLEPLSKYSFYAYLKGARNSVIESGRNEFTTTRIPEDEMVYISDPVLKDYVVRHYDQDGDCEISYAEAECVDYIDMDGNEIEDLSGVREFRNLSHLHVWAATTEEDRPLGKVTHIDLSGLSSLSTIYFTGQKMTEVDMTGCFNLRNIEIGYSNLETVDFTDTRLAEYIEVGHSHIKQLDIRGLDCLEQIHCYYTPLESVQLSNKKLESIICDSTNLEVLDVTSCPLLSLIGCNDCPKLEKIILSRDQKITIHKDEHTIIEYK